LAWLCCSQFRLFLVFYYWTDYLNWLNWLDFNLNLRFIVRSCRCGIASDFRLILNLSLPDLLVNSLLFKFILCELHSRQDSCFCKSDHALLLFGLVLILWRRPWLLAVVSSVIIWWSRVIRRVGVWPSVRLSAFFVATAVTVTVSFIVTVLTASSVPVSFMSPIISGTSGSVPLTSLLLTGSTYLVSVPGVTAPSHISTMFGHFY
jgi:hypothetical protein